MAGAEIPDCTGLEPSGGTVAIDAEVVCFDSGPSPLFRRLTYSTIDGSVISIDYFDTDGAPAVPTGTPIACGEGPAAVVSVIGPVGPGACADAVRVTQCEPVIVTADPTADVRARRSNLLGAATWAVGVDTVGKVKSVSIRRRPGGATAGVTISDSGGTVSTLLVGETETWSVTALEDEIVGPLSVTGVAASDVIITWTEV